MTTGKAKQPLFKAASANHAAVLRALVAVVFLLPALGGLAAGADNAIEETFVAAGLVDVRTVDSFIRVDLVNSDPKKNFFRRNFYDGLDKAYLRPAVSIKLAGAQAILKKRHPGYALLVLDAARPRSVSRAMYEKVKGTRYERYVANPAKGSMHNYGVAVDITIVDDRGHELDMGFSPFRKGTAAMIWQLTRIKLGAKVTQKQRLNRKLLSDVMKKAGFLPLPFEWWHFNGLPKDVARKTYPIIE